MIHVNTHSSLPRRPLFTALTVAVVSVLFSAPLYAVPEDDENNRTTKRQIINDDEDRPKTKRQKANDGSSRARGLTVLREACDWKILEIHSEACNQYANGCQMFDLGLHQNALAIFNGVDSYFYTFSSHPEMAEAALRDKIAECQIHLGIFPLPVTNFQSAIAAGGGAYQEPLSTAVKMAQYHEESGSSEEALASYRRALTATHFEESAVLDHTTWPKIAARQFIKRKISELFIESTYHRDLPSQCLQTQVSMATGETQFLSRTSSPSDSVTASESSSREGEHLNSSHPELSSDEEEDSSTYDEEENMTLREMKNRARDLKKMYGFLSYGTQAAL